MTPGGEGPVWRRLPLGQAAVERAAHRRADTAWLDRAWRVARVLVVDDRGRVPVVARDGRPALAFVGPDGAPAGERLFLGEDAAGPYFAVLADLPAVPGSRPATLREVGVDLDGHGAALVAEAVGLANWHRAYRYSPRTGAPLVWRAGGWEAEASDGSGVIWPRTNPAVIVLVHDGVAGTDGRCLLGRGPGWREGWYSCVAGFVEPGESAEAAVVREVAEETGVAVDRITYVASQAWPLPASLMLGFTAIGDPTQPVTPDGVEVSDARWFTRDELAGLGPGPQPTLSPPLSIAHELIASWRDRP